MCPSEPADLLDAHGLCLTTGFRLYGWEDLWNWVNGCGDGPVVLVRCPQAPGLSWHLIAAEAWSRFARTGCALEQETGPDGSGFLPETHHNVGVRFITSFHLAGIARTVVCCAPPHWSAPARRHGRQQHCQLGALCQRPCTGPCLAHMAPSWAVAIFRTTCAGRDTAAHLAPLNCVLGHRSVQRPLSAPKSAGFAAGRQLKHRAQQRSFFESRLRGRVP